METWLNDSILDSIIQYKNAFHIFRQDRRSAKGGGILILVPKNIASRLEPKGSKITEFAEMLSIQVVIKSQRITLSCVYRPPGHVPINDPKAKTFLNDLAEISQLGMASIIVGDFNLPKVDWNLNGANTNTGFADKFFRHVSNLGLTQIVTSPTRDKAILDICLVSNTSLISSINCSAPFGYPPNESDHKSLTIQSNLPVDPKNPRLKFRSFARAPWHDMEHFLLSISWEDFFEQCTDVDGMVENFNLLCTLIIQKFVPHFVKTRRNFCFPMGSRWLYRLNQIEKRRRKSHHRSINHYYARTKISKLIRAIKRTGNTNQEEAILKSKNPKRFWQYVNSKLKTRQPLPIITNVDGALCVTNQQKAHAFSSFFASVFSTPAEPHTSTPSVVNYPRKPLPRLAFTPTIVLAYLRQLPSNSAASSDKIPNKFLKSLAVPLAQPLAKIFTVSYLTGRFPKLWKSALVIPIPKKPNSQEVGQYRPISLNSTVSKVMEKIIRASLICFLSENSIIPREQHGFLPRRSVETQLLTCLNHWTLALDKSIPTDVAYFDIAKAFDTVDHAILLEKLLQMGLPKLFLGWIASYLHNRRQVVKVAENFSDSRDITSGVPQGSVLGPILFIIFTSDLPQCIHHSEIAIYADDLKIYRKIQNPNDSALLQQDINSVANYFAQNNLKIASHKCALLRIGPGCASAYSVQDLPIENVAQIRDLGVIIDSKLSFKPHIANIVKAASSYKNCLLRCFQSKNATFRKNMFQTFARSKMEFATTCWSPYQLSLIRDAESPQRSFTKYIPGLFESPYINRCNSVGLQPLAIRRAINDLVLCHKVLHGYFPHIKHEDFFDTVQPKSTRGHSLKLRKPSTKTECRKNFWCVRVIDNWNSLPPNIVAIKNHSTFKKFLTTNAGTVLNSLFQKLEQVF